MSNFSGAAGVIDQKPIIGRLQVSRSPCRTRQASGLRVVVEVPETTGEAKNHPAMGIKVIYKCDNQHSPD